MQLRGAGFHECKILKEVAQGWTRRPKSADSLLFKCSTAEEKSIWVFLRMHSLNVPLFWFECPRGF
jgi:hypothetical protein